MPAVYRTSTVVVAFESHDDGGIAARGEVGLLEDPGTPEELAEAIGGLPADPATAGRIGAARVNVEVAFELKAVPRRVEETHAPALAEG